MKKLLFVVAFVFSCIALQAQDKIHMKNGKVIDGKVTEVGTEEIKYKVDPQPDAAIFSVKKIDVAKIEFESGHVEKYMEEIENPDSYSGQNTRMVKVDFLSPIMGFTGLGYEQLIRPGMSWEANIGLIGLGNDIDEERPRGANIRGGIRFLKTPDFKSGNTRYWHVLKGAYVKPEIAFGMFERNYEVWDYTNWMNPVQHKGRQTVTYGAVNLVIGKQAVFADVFAVDIFAGVGYGFKTFSDIPHFNGTERSYEGGRLYGMVIAGSNFPISATAGIKFGFLFK